MKLEEFKKKYPEFNYNYYINFNYDLLKEKNILEHFETICKDEVIIISFESFKKYNPQFNYYYFFKKYEHFIKSYLLNNVNQLNICLTYCFFRKLWNEEYFGLINIKDFKKFCIFYINYYTNLFDYKYYFNKYPDLNDYGLNNKSKLLNHWLKNGVKEGRIGSIEYIKTKIDYEYYLKKYPDLGKNGIKNNNQVLKHYINNGVKENREINYYEKLKHFDIEFYKLYYEDLQEIKDDLSIIEHHVYTGILEGRLINIDDFINHTGFDWKFYNNSYKDLKNIKNERENVIHYLKYGKYENRNKTLKDKSNRIVILHIGSLQIMKKIINRFKINNLFCIITYYDDVIYKDIINNFTKIIKIMKVENKGMDCGPMLLCIKYILKNIDTFNYNSIFLKIHTKSNDEWRDNLIEKIIDYNLTIFDKPVLFGSNDYFYDNNKNVNREYVTKIVERNNFDINIYNKYFDKYYDEMVTPEKNLNKFNILEQSLNFYKNYEPDLYYIEDLEHWHLYGKYETHRINNVNYIKQYSEYENKFIAGTIFGFNLEWIKLFKKINLDFEYSILEKKYIDNVKNSKTHAWEYFFNFITLLERGFIYSINNNNLCQKLKYETKLLNKIKYSVINIPFHIPKIAFFLIIPGDNPVSGGYRTLLKYINYLNNNNINFDIYFGICWNKEDLDDNTKNLNINGMPICSNWLNKNDIIYKILNNLDKYNEIDLKKNNYYLGFRCQKKYDNIIANAWQTAAAVYFNKNYSKKISYIVQDREELFYINHEIKERVLNTYYDEFYYFTITKYLENYFKNVLKKKNISVSSLGCNINIYKNLNLERNNSIAIPYYKNEKKNRMPQLVEKIINILSQKYKCFIFPLNYKSTNKNIINIGPQSEQELNALYNICKVGIIFSNSNPSRLGIEMICSGLNVIEYDSEFTKLDFDNKYFTKIKNENNITKIVQNLLNKKFKIDEKNFDCIKDLDNFLNFIKK